jgi:hypothetical protein
MIRRSEWGHRRSIRCSVWIKTETRQDEVLSTEWTTSWSRGSVGLSDGRMEATRDVLVVGSSAPDDLTERQSIASEQLCQRSCAVETTASSTGWTDTRKNIASDHLTVLLSATFSQRLVWCLGLFIPPPLTHLRLLDCVEVQESARHLEYYIKSIQVLNCSSIYLHMLSVCA